MNYKQLTPEERYTLATLRMQRPRLSKAAIARIMGRHPSTICRELRRNHCEYDGRYRASRAQEKTNGRRSRSRRNSHFTPAQFRLVERRLKEGWSPQQISERLRSKGELDISHERIYQYILADKRAGGDLYLCLRQPIKPRKRYASKERRGRLEGKRHISERPASIEDRREIGHWEIDTVHGAGDGACVVTLVERVTGKMLIGKLVNHTAAELTRRVTKLIRREPQIFKTITADNGSEFHDYRSIEKATGVTFYFATHYHSWERGTNENANGLLRQYLPKRHSMRTLSQPQCNSLAALLNSRPRKRLGYLTPDEKLLLEKSQKTEAVEASPPCFPTSHTSVTLRPRQRCTSNLNSRG